jgi:hypothetical protein
MAKVTETDDKKLVMQARNANGPWHQFPLPKTKNECDEWYLLCAAPFIQQGIEFRFLPEDQTL